jgi:nucleoside-diphosphate-sugar epimerase
MKALILGGSGFLGRNLQEHLQTMGIEYDMIGRNWYSTLTEAGNYDLVFFLAGEVRNVADMYEANVKLLYRALSMSLNWDCVFIYVGSSSEYGRMDRPMKETDPINPTNMYEATKGIGTLMCQGFAREFNRPILIFRPSSVYGKYERLEKFIPTVIRKTKAGEPVDVYPGSHDWIYVDDFISAMFHVIQTLDLQESPEGIIFNVSSGEEVDNLRMAQLVGVAMGINHIGVVLHEKKFHEHDTESWSVDNSKLKALGWRPKYDIHEGLKKTVMEILEEK